MYLVVVVENPRAPRAQEVALLQLAASTQPAVAAFCPLISAGCICVRCVCDVLGEVHALNPLLPPAAPSTSYSSSTRILIVERSVWSIRQFGRKYKVRFVVNINIKTDLKLTTRVVCYAGVIILVSVCGNGTAVMLPRLLV